MARHLLVEGAAATHRQQGTESQRTAAASWASPRPCLGCLPHAVNKCWSCFLARRLSTRGRRTCRPWWCLTDPQWTYGRLPTGAQQTGMRCGSGLTPGTVPARRCCRRRCSSHTRSGDGRLAVVQQGVNCNV